MVLNPKHGIGFKDGKEVNKTLGFHPQPELDKLVQEIR